MASFTFFFSLIFIFSIISTFLHTEAHTKCSNGGPDIRYPFRTTGQRQVHPKLDDSAFELLCEENTTKIHFPSYGDLVVNSISYGAKRLDLADPKGCVHQVFLSLDLSNTPFRYYYHVKNYTYLNCSEKLSPVFAEIPCLSGFMHHVYTVEPSMVVPDFCRPIKTVAIPFKYSPYLADNSFGLRLTWGFLGDQDCDGEEGPCGSQIQTGGFRVGPVQVLSLGVFAFALASAFLAIKMVYHSKELVCQKELGNDQIENTKYLGEYEAFVSDEAYVAKVSDRC